MRSRAATVCVASSSRGCSSTSPSAFRTVKRESTGHRTQVAAPVHTCWRAVARLGRACGSAWNGSSNGATSSSIGLSGCAGWLSIAPAITSASSARARYGSSAAGSSGQSSITPYSDRIRMSSGASRGAWPLQCRVAPPTPYT